MVTTKAYGVCFFSYVDSDTESHTHTHIITYTITHTHTRTHRVLIVLAMCLCIQRVQFEAAGKKIWVASSWFRMIGAIMQRHVEGNGHVRSCGPNPYQVLEAFLSDGLVNIWFKSHHSLTVLIFDLYHFQRPSRVPDKF